VRSSSSKITASELRLDSSTGIRLTGSSTEGEERLGLNEYHSYATHFNFKWLTINEIFKIEIF